MGLKEKTKKKTRRRIKHVECFTSFFFLLARTNYRKKTMIRLQCVHGSVIWLCMTFFFLSFFSKWISTVNRLWHVQNALMYVKTCHMCYKPYRFYFLICVPLFFLSLSLFSYFFVLFFSIFSISVAREWWFRIQFVCLYLFFFFLSL